MLAALTVLPLPESSCAGAACAGVLWAVAAGYEEVADVSGPALPLAHGFETIPTGVVTLLPSRTTGADSRPVSLADHFTARSLRRVAAARAAGGAPVNDICTTAVRPTFQLGLCHSPDSWSYGQHDTVAANVAAQARISEPEASSADARLLEHVTPLVLPPGTVMELLDQDVPALRPAFVRLVHRSVAWALWTPPHHRSTAWMATQALVALAGHRLTVLAPGRLCNMSELTTVVAPAGHTPPAELAAILARHLASSPQPLPLLERPGLAAARRHAGPIGTAAGMTAAEVARLERWLRLMELAYAAAAAITDDEATNTTSTTQALVSNEDTASWPTAGHEFPEHCWVDHANVRDHVLSINFNTWGNWSEGVLRRLRRLYAPYFPLIVAFGGDWGMKEDQPHLNAWRCSSEWGRDLGWPGGIVGEVCGAELVRLYPGRLGYVLSQDDVLWMPWNTLAYDPHRIWALGHEGKHGDRSTWFYDCDRSVHKLPDGGPHYCYGCYTWHPTIGGVALASVHARFTASQLATKAANTGRADGMSCDLTDAFYVPGRLAVEFAGLARLLHGARAAVELAYSTILDSLAPRREQQRLRHYNANQRRSLEELAGHWTDPAVFPPGAGSGSGALRLLDWFHPLKMSAPDVADFVEQQFARADDLRLFTAPNITALAARPRIEVGHL